MAAIAATAPLPGAASRAGDGVEKLLQAEPEEGLEEANREAVLVDVDVEGRGSRS